MEGWSRSVLQGGKRMLNSIINLFSLFDIVVCLCFLIFLYKVFIEEFVNCALQQQASDPSRLFLNRGCNLLKEEKARTKFIKELPKVRIYNNNNNVNLFNVTYYY